MDGQVRLIDVAPTVCDALSLDAGEALWNLRKLSSTPPPEAFVGATNSDLAFKGDYAIQGNYNGIQIWDISDPSAPELVTEYVCPASQSDVSVYGDLLFVSGEGLEGRLDCGTQGVDTQVSPDRLRGIRIFDISDIRAPEYVANVQTCRGSHTHSVLKDPDDDENVYVYVSGSAPVTTIFLSVLTKCSVRKTEKGHCVAISKSTAASVRKAPSKYTWVRLKRSWSPAEPPSGRSCGSAVSAASLAPARAMCDVVVPASLSSSSLAAVWSGSRSRTSSSIPRARSRCPCAA